MKSCSNGRGLANRIDDPLQPNRRLKSGPSLHFGQALRQTARAPAAVGVAPFYGPHLLSMPSFAVQVVAESNVTGVRLATPINSLPYAQPSAIFPV